MGTFQNNSFEVILVNREIVDFQIIR
jgi:hypothetical protein